MLETDKYLLGRFRARNVIEGMGKKEGLGERDFQKMKFKYDRICYAVCEIDVFHPPPRHSCLPPPLLVPPWYWNKETGELYRSSSEDYSAENSGGKVDATESIGLLIISSLWYEEATEVEIIIDIRRSCGTAGNETSEWIRTKGIRIPLVTIMSVISNGRVWTVSERIPSIACYKTSSNSVSLRRSALSM